MNIRESVACLLFIMIGFFSGSIMFSRIIPMIIIKRDICAISDDSNPGATNVFKTCGVIMGLTCLFMDMLKGFLPVFAALGVISKSSLIFAVIMSAPVFGHAVAPFNGFHGGKCIATTFGVLLALLPSNIIVFLLALIYILLSTVFIINPTRKRSIVTFFIFGLISAVILICTGQYSIAFGCLIISAIVIIKHKSSIAVSNAAAEMTPCEAETANVVQ